MAISAREKRTVLMGAAALGIYLVLFYGIGGWKFLQKKRAEYDELHKTAITLRDQIRFYQDRAVVVSNLMNTYHMDPARLSSNTVVAGASEAIQKAAQGSGLQVGPIRESGPHTSGKELATMQIECSGPVNAMMGLLKRMETLGYPLVIESVQISPENSRPGQIKFSLAVVVLDFEQWKRQEGEPHV
jgi:hypothetical protein